MGVFKVKVVGLSFNKVESPVKESDYVILRADSTNEFDSDAVAVFNGEQELVGHVANSDRTLSATNRENGNISASELKDKIDFTDKEFRAEVVKAYSSCLYLEVNENKFTYLNSVGTSSPEISDVGLLLSEIVSLKAMVKDLKDEVASLKVLVTVGGEDNSSLTTSDGRVLYSIVGLSHFDGQDHLDYELSIEEEPIFENAKGTALYLKSGDYRVGVFPSVKKKEYCEEHGIPYVEGNSLKGKNFNGNVMIEEIVYNEYCVISI